MNEVLEYSVTILMFIFTFLYISSAHEKSQRFKSARKYVQELKVAPDIDYMYDQGYGPEYIAAVVEIYFENLEES